MSMYRLSTISLLFFIFLSVILCEKSTILSFFSKKEEKEEEDYLHATITTSASAFSL